MPSPVRVWRDDDAPWNPCFHLCTNEDVITGTVYWDEGPPTAPQLGPAWSAVVNGSTEHHQLMGLPSEAWLSAVLSGAAMVARDPSSDDVTPEGSRRQLPWRHEDDTLPATDLLDTGLRLDSSGALLNGCWVLNTNPDDYANLLQSSGVEPHSLGWTVTSKVRRGDLVVVYGHGANQTFGYAGRIASDAERSELDGGFWSWLRVDRVGTPLALADAKRSEMIAAWPSLRVMNWSCRGIDAAAFAELHCLARGDGGRVWELPAAVHASLADADREFDNTDGSGRLHELTLQDRIRRAWIAEGTARQLTPDDNVKVPASGHLGNAGFADIVLVDTTKPRTLLAIEVKRAARPGKSTEGVGQALRYKTRLESIAPGWSVEAVLVALHISPTVRAQARAAHVTCWIFDVDDDGFYEPEG